MITGIGVDCATITRIEKSIQKEHFCKKVFSDEEWQALSALAPHRKAESAAACFAAKEAFLKAAGVGLGGFALRDIAALRHESGRPYYKLSGTAEKFCQDNGMTAHLSLSHEGDMAIAFAILEKTD